MTTDAQDFVERLTNACTEAKDLLREMRSEAKELRRLIAMAKAAAEVMDTAIAGLADQHIAEEVQRQLDKFGQETKKAMDRSVKHVNDQFDRLANILMTGNVHGKADVAAAMQRVAKRKAQGYELPRAGRRLDDPMR